MSCPVCPALINFEMAAGRLVVADKGASVAHPHPFKPIEERGA